jgi:hypothetical protein
MQGMRSCKAGQDFSGAGGGTPSGEAKQARTAPQCRQLQGPLAVWQPLTLQDQL